MEDAHGGFVPVLQFDAAGRWCARHVRVARRPGSIERVTMTELSHEPVTGFEPVAEVAFLGR
jgi:hypothetical protein